MTRGFVGRIGSARSADRGNGKVKKREDAEDDYAQSGVRCGMSGNCFASDSAEETQVECSVDEGRCADWFAAASRSTMFPLGEARLWSACNTDLTLLSPSNDGAQRS